jgi:hypothetical protein
VGKEPPEALARVVNPAIKALLKDYQHNDKDGYCLCH